MCVCHETHISVLGPVCVTSSCVACEQRMVNGQCWEDAHKIHNTHFDVCWELMVVQSVYIYCMDQAI